MTLGLGAAVYAIVRAPEVGWASAATWWAMGAAAVLLVAFLMMQRPGVSR